MAASSTIVSSSLLPSRIQSLTNTCLHQKLSFLPNWHHNRNFHIKKPRNSFRVQAVKPPSGVCSSSLSFSPPFFPPFSVEFPKVQPQFKAPFLGFTKTAEIWNSRACMIGIIGVFIVELIINKGILQVLGVDIGKGLDLPL
ncbi:hypothetical protein QN277_023396 [Acacia crassicarpa]|uniref:Uncharacterized protein n=1 Tax=Acacia crassicarpa TaxID=499986 RepID=A0AAE1MQM2_9FABA|nr:hypothetical protein QN277_023396 [Acacia crassicarpa]